MISFIIVTYNCGDKIVGTLESIRSQDNNNYEIIIIDGGSIDGTLKAIEDYRFMIDYFISEKDFGIYFAMNKGLRLANGSLVMFLGAGDELKSRDIVSYVSNIEMFYDFDIIIGSVVYSYKDSQKIKIFNHINKFTIPYYDICHQAVFAKKTLFDRHGDFSTNYKYASDYCWILNVLKAGAKIHKTKKIFSLYDAYGVSSVNENVVLKERAEILNKNTNRFFYWVLFFIVKSFKRIFRVGYERAL